MSLHNGSVVAREVRPPLHAWLVPAPVVCFIGTFLTDLAYWRTADMQWANFSIWLLTAGLVMAGVSVVAGIVDVVLGWRSRVSASIWIRVLTAALVIVLSVVNAFVHSRDAYTSVVPTGMMLSGLVVLIMIVGAWLARPRLAVRHLETVR